jgi:hypothetical protein
VCVLFSYSLGRGRGLSCFTFAQQRGRIKCGVSLLSSISFPFGRRLFFNGMFALGLMDRNDGGLDQMGTMVLYEHLLINDRIEERRVQTAVDEAGWDREGDEDGALLYGMCIF